uniref:HD domain-containing protein n=1 Tax=Streptomyces sp. NBC_00049 TaxID=2903617 RepID=A0AAU2JWZ2_9ACTN
MARTRVPEPELPYVSSVPELMDLLHGCPDDRALRTAALLRRSHPFDKELQIAGLLHDIGRMLRPGEGVAHAARAAEAIRPLLGDRVARLVRLHASAGADRRYGEDGADGPHPVRGNGGRPGEDGRYEAHGADGADGGAVATLRHAHEAAAVSCLDAGVLEDWRPLLELVSAGARAGNATGPLGVPRGPVAGRS